MERKKVYISQVHPNEGQIEGLPANPRLIKDERFKKLMKSIQDLPEMTEARDLLVYPYGGDYVVIGGNMRLRAYQELGWKEVPCCVLPDNMPVDKLREMVIQDNNPFGETDWNMIANEWDVEELKDWGVDLPEDWDTSEAEEQKEAEEDDFSDEDAEKAEPRVKPGEIWQLGEHRLMCGDSTDAESVAMLMRGEISDMNFMSPPYNIGKNAKLSDKYKNNKYITYNDENVDYKELLYKSTSNSINISKYSFINIQFLSGNKNVFCEYLNEFKDSLCDIAVWYKDNVQPAMASRVMNSSFEFILIFGSGNINRAIGTRDFRGNVSNVFQSHIQMHNDYSKIHSATFPVEFVSNYINNFTNSKEIVTDLFGGTGTTLIACEQLNRKCYMMELDPHYCDVIIARWEKLTGKEAVKVYG